MLFDYDSFCDPLLALVNMVRSTMVKSTMSDI